MKLVFLRLLHSNYKGDARFEHLFVIMRDFGIGDKLTRDFGIRGRADLGKAGVCENLMTSHCLKNLYGNGSCA